MERSKLWSDWFYGATEARCTLCLSTQITLTNFRFGFSTDSQHQLSLRPVCSLCHSYLSQTNFAKTLGLFSSSVKTESSEKTVNANLPDLLARLEDYDFKYLSNTLKLGDYPRAVLIKVMLNMDQNLIIRLILRQRYLHPYKIEFCNLCLKQAEVTQRISVHPASRFAASGSSLFFY
jgi:hypothetical protein